jgi:hypothetical protein
MVAAEISRLGSLDACIPVSIAGRRALLVAASTGMGFRPQP